jgi:hypothetical protein
MVISTAPIARRRSPIRNRRILFSARLVQLGLHDGLQRGFVQRDAEAGSEGDIDGAVGHADGDVLSG